MTNNQLPFISGMPGESYSSISGQEYIQRLIEFYVRLWHLHWNAENNSYHVRIEECMDALHDYIDTTAEQYLGATPSDISFTQATPVENGEDPISLAYGLKQYVKEWADNLPNDIDEAGMEGFKNAAFGFIEELNKFIYLFRLCKD